MIDEIKENKIKFETMVRDPSEACEYYAAFCLLFALILRVVYFSTFICVCWLVGALFPILIVFIERDDFETQHRQEKMRRLSDAGLSFQDIQSILQKEERTKIPIVSELSLSQKKNQNELLQNVKANLGEPISTASRTRALSEEGFDIISDHEDNN
ncbi:hypothetical protein RFI_27279 [Reticulomyxa filosa]|uniref:Uncharacterized protein n=1 Tax=Reticulomyxa filosa TaxID=46433 RepID=X6MAN4_RETFI|nr:hypothetical protein RFI_27279 [Reticulomyxa filosa]|eukprot:ETO10100.1 hypothetical protein RFI_27279 [Reticulomyxa filosa]